ncbi:MAG: FHA domain-containing protein [Chloroflexi bacterium]|nr:FHA domain-containing protein [Chloroflexota bacterium]
MDALDVAILALRLALVLLLYLFLAVVVRLAARGLNASAPASAPVAAQRTAELQLLVEDPASSALPAGGVIGVPDGATLGRAERAGLVLADPTVSAEHARIRRQGRRWTVADLGSTNGTLINDRRVDREAPLADGDILALGNVRLRVVAT